MSAAARRLVLLAVLPLAAAPASCQREGAAAPSFASFALAEELADFD
ncbi:MAG: hypothetical protein ISR76_10855, partial [Planctomycetes bacterium]|nr:hypothetical protein [Planctomycetota bacterium]